MPAYNNGFGGMQNNIWGNGFNTGGINNNGWNTNTGFGNNGMGNGYQNPGYNVQQDNHYLYYDYVSGRTGADAYQMPSNVNRVLLFDNDNDRYFIKEYDNNGRPRVVADNDFTPHVDPEPTQNAPIDLTPYATKDDLRQMLSDAINQIAIPNMGEYVTRGDLNKALSGLSVGNGGRIVRANESNA